MISFQCWHRNRIRCSTESCPNFVQSSTWAWRGTPADLTLSKEPYLYPTGRSALFRSAWHPHFMHVLEYLKSSSSVVRRGTKEVLGPLKAGPKTRSLLLSLRCEWRKYVGLSCSQSWLGELFPSVPLLSWGQLKGWHLCFPPGVIGFNLAPLPSFPLGTWPFLNLLSFETMMHFICQQDEVQEKRSKLEASIV